jgi:hypothetical protein
MTKVINLLDRDADLKAWYQIADAQKEHFETSASRDGFYSPKPYQMYVAAKICWTISKGEKDRFVMTLGPG